MTKKNVNPLIDNPHGKLRNKKVLDGPKTAAGHNKAAKKTSTSNKKKSLDQINIDYTHEGDGMACVDGVFRGEDWSELDS